MPLLLDQHMNNCSIKTRRWQARQGACMQHQAEAGSMSLCLVAHSDPVIVEGIMLLDMSVMPKRI